MGVNLLGLWRASRPIMVLVSIFSVLLALAVAGGHGAAVVPFEAGLLMLGVVLAHVGFNLLCSYHDVISGFASRSAAMPFNNTTMLVEAQSSLLRRAAAVLISLALLVGGYFVLAQGLGLLFPILFSLLMVVSYHRWALRKPHVGLILSGIVLGPVLIVSTHYALTGVYDFDALYVSLASFFLICNLFLLNQYPNYHLNLELGRFYFPVVYGTKRSSVVHVVFSLGVLYVIGMGDIIGLLPEQSPWAMVPMLLALYAVVGGFKFGTDGERLRPHLWANMAALLLVELMLVVLLFCQPLSSH